MNTNSQRDRVCAPHALNWAQATANHALVFSATRSSCQSETKLAAPLTLVRGRQLARPAVSMLRPPGRSVTQVELDEPAGSQVLEVTPRGAAADACLLRDLYRR